MTKDVVLMIGAGRSGTSALTRTLSLCGWRLPPEVLGPMEINPRGSWEPVDVWKENHRFMLAHDSAFGDPTMRLQEVTSNLSSMDDYIRSAQRQMANHGGGGVLLIKQPDITEVLELWIEAAKRECVSLKIIIPIRQPTEVYASLRAAGAVTSVEAGNAFWLKRNLLAERFSRGLPRVFVDYGIFLHDWQREILRISKALNVAIDPDEASIGRFLAPDLHRQRSSTMVNETFGYSWVTRVYAILFGAAQDAEIDLQAMDEIYYAFRACERSFRIASQEFYERLGSITQQGLQRTLEQAPVLRTGADYDQHSG